MMAPQSMAGEKMIRRKDGPDFETVEAEAQKYMARGLRVEMEGSGAGRGGT